MYKVIGQLKVENDWLKKNLNRSVVRDGRKFIITSEMEHISIERQCELLEIPRSSYYYKDVYVENEQNLALMRRIDEIHLQHPYYGVLRIREATAADLFTANEFIQTVPGKEIKFSMDRKGRAIDNVCIERFWRSLKYEKIYWHGYSNNLELFIGITEYVEFYNNHRKHQSLDYQIPVEIFQLK